MWNNGKRNNTYDNYKLVFFIPYDKTQLQLLMLNNDTNKTILANISSFFVMISYKVVTLTYDQIYLLLLMFKMVQGKLFITVISSFLSW